MDRAGWGRTQVMYAEFILKVGNGLVEMMSDGHSGLDWAGMQDVYSSVGVVFGGKSKG